MLERNHLKPYNNYYAPNIATSCVTNDGLVYNITLNPNAKFADGSKLNATDVKYSFDLVTDTDLHDGYYTYFSYNLANCTTTILSEYELQIVLNQRYVFPESLLSFEIIPKHIWENISPGAMGTQAETWALYNPTKLVGAGPYYLNEYDNVNEIIHLKRNPYYANWTGITPYFEDIYFELYTSKEEALLSLLDGTIDMVDAQFSTQIDEVPVNCKYELVDDPGTQEIAINQMHPILGTGELCPIAGTESARHVRKAISYMVPRDLICEEILNGLAQPGVTGCPSTAFCFNKSLLPYEYSEELALEHMALAGYEVPSIPIVSIGITLPVFMSILGVIGGSITIINKKSNK